MHSVLVILVVDDKPENLLVVRAALGELDYRVPSTQPELLARPAAADKGSEPGSEPGSGPLNVALVEDNDDSRVLMGELLSSWGHAVSQATTGQVGIELIVKQRPDIAFVDLGLARYRWL